MRYIQTFTGFLNEGVMAPSDIYKVKEDGEEYSDYTDSLQFGEYIFNTPTQQYRVRFEASAFAEGSRPFEVSFGFDAGKLNQIDVHTMTNEGNVRTLLKTISYIIEEFLFQYDEEVSDVIIAATDPKRKRLYQTLLPQFLSRDAFSRVTIK